MVTSPSDKVVNLWSTRLIKGDTGKPRALLANVITGLTYATEWQGILHFNLLTQQTMLCGVPPWGMKHENREWTDSDDTQVADWFQHAGIHVSSSVAAEAVSFVAKARSFHPVRDYLASIAWDGEPRLDTWTVRFLGAADDLYHRAVGVKWMISAVARIQQPGCKADCAIILEGPQGILKSTAVQVLADPWFSDELAELGTKDASLQTAGAWIIEIAELDAMSKTEVHKIKAFMSRRVDRFRPPYGRRVEEFARQCVFAGTVNMSDYLRDETGGRRFWPIKCSKIDIEALRSAKDQLWAEAQHRYNDGETWWLDDQLTVDQASEHQRARYQGDAWQPKIDEWLVGRTQTSVGEILGGLFNVTADKWTQADQNRISRCLRSIGWNRVQVRTGDRRTWLYRVSGTTLDEK